LTAAAEITSGTSTTLPGFPANGCDAALNPSRSTGNAQAKAQYSAHRMLDVLVSEVVLERSGIMAVIGEFEQAWRADARKMASSQPSRTS
jgi:hypothetical protein